MKAIDLKSARAFQSRNDKSLGIQTYGEENNFPQLVSKIVGASCTGRSCLKVYNDFVYGKGFADEALQSLVVNKRGNTLGEVLKMAAADFTKFNGFALHVNYNALYQVVEVHHGPFEHYRFEKVDTETGHFSKIAEHDDWAREFEGVKRFKKQDITFYDLFDPRPEVIAAQVAAAGGWENYKGQVLYYSSEGDLIYPAPIYEPELTDMRTEEATANVIGRNAANGFFTAGALIDINNEDQSEEEAEGTKQTLREFQGDDKASQLLYLQVRSKDEVPQFISFSGENYDKALSQTQQVIPNNIGRVFNQPPILRAQDVGANFGADLMINAYNYYNSKTSGERQTLEEVFKKVLRLWHEPVGADLSILPLSYASGRSMLSRLGQVAVDKIVEIAKDSTIDGEIRKSILKLGYDLTDEEVASLVSIAPPVVDTDSLAVQLGVGGTQSLTMIMESATLDDKQKRGLLEVVFGLSAEDINSLFGQ